MLCYHEHRFPISPDTLTVPRRLELRIPRHPERRPRRPGRGDSKAALPAGRLAARQRRAELPPLLRHLHARRHPGGRPARVRRSPRTGVALVCRAAWIDGFRVDHPDGLHDPKEYFERLRAAAPQRLDHSREDSPAGRSYARGLARGGHHRLRFHAPRHRVVCGPGGRDAVDRAFTPSSPASRPITAWSSAKSNGWCWANCSQAEVNWLTRLLVRIAARHWRYRDLAESDLREALIDVTARLPVYCTYVQAHLGRVPEADAAVISETVAWVRQRRSDLPPEAFDFIENLLLLRLATAKSNRSSSCASSSSPARRWPRAPRTPLATASTG